jgi:nicotinate-nucleotide adenylyltransferase
VSWQCDFIFRRIALRLGIFGGTFDPIHNGHLRAAEEVAEQLKLNKVLFIPSANPPHRMPPEASPHHRWAMTCLAVGGNSVFYGSDLEIKRPGKSYTVDTLSAISRQFPRAKKYLIMGADQSLALPLWHQAELLPRYCRIVVMTRPGITLSEFFSSMREYPKWFNRRNVQLLQVSALDISSTEIRKRIKQNRSIRYLVPKEVMQYISRHRLYLAK